MSAVLSPSIGLPEFPFLNPSTRLDNKIYPSGNKCGHDPKNPRFLSTINPYDDKAWKDSDRDHLGSRRKSHFFYEFNHRINQAFNHSKMMKSFSYHEGSGRRKRTEAREAGIAVMTVMVNWMNGANRKFGRMPKDRIEAADVGFVYYDNKFLAAKANLTPSRTKRSIKWLVEKDYIERKHRHEHNPDGSYKGKASATRIKRKLFRELALEDKLKKHYQFSYKKAQEHAKRLGIGISRALNSAFIDVTKFTKPKNKNKDVPGDFPQDDMRHWTCRLRKEQHGDFQFNYAQVQTDSPQMSKEMALSEAYKITTT